MKKKLIGLVAMLVLASMMLVMFSGCVHYDLVRHAVFKVDKKTITVDLFQYANDNNYDKNKFSIAVDIDGNATGNAENLSQFKLQNGTCIPVKNITNSKVVKNLIIYIYGIDENSFDSNGKIKDSCKLTCQLVYYYNSTRGTLETATMAVKH